MNARSIFGTAVGILAGLSVITAATDASADPVGNPGTFDFIITPGTDSAFWFGSSSALMELAPTNGYFFTADLDSDGVVSGVSSSLPVATYTVAGTPGVTAQLILQGSSEGEVSVPDRLLDFYSMRARVRFTWPSGGSATSCTTGVFEIDLSTDNWDPLWGVCTIPYDESTGEFCMAASDFVVPALGPMACGGKGDDLNTYFDLGRSSGSYMQILLGYTDPPITQ